LERLRIVLDRLRDVGLKAKPSKCELFKTEIKFLGHMVSADGINPLPDKLEAIRDWPVPPLPSRNYCTTRRELLAVICALQHFRHYLLGTKVVSLTDLHSLKWLQTFKRPEGILARWVETLGEFDFTIEHRPGRLHSNFDGVSRPFCKQCLDKVTKVRWVDKLDRADELTEPLGVRWVVVTTEIPADHAKEFQAEDSDLGPVIDWMTEGQTPAADVLRQHSLETRKLCGQYPAVHLSDGMLVRKLFDTDVAQMVVPHRLRKPLFAQSHSGPLAAHLGAQRTFLQLKSAYYWPGMKGDVIRWCKECEVCAQSKGPPNRRQGRLQKVLTGAPLDIVAVDVSSGLPATPDGKKYILVLTDYFTKWACAFALPDASHV